jgi:hypothetical protein
MDELRQDLRYLWRQMARSPVFAGAAILSLALGIGANTAIFSLMDAVLFRTLPVRDPQQLVYLAHDGVDGLGWSANYPLLARYQAAGVLESVTAYSGSTFAVRVGSAPPEDVEGQHVAGNYHQTIGAPFVLGHGFLDDDAPAIPALRSMPSSVIATG